MKHVFVISGLLFALASAQAAAQDRQIRVAVTVSATPQQAWHLWTTNEGVQSFFAPGSNIELRVDGLYEIYFAPNAPPGMRGADGMRLLSVEPNKRIAFTWNAPASLPYVRAQRTVVTVDFVPVGSNRTQVVLCHIGWGTGKEWDEAIAYFDKAWNGFVMPMFKHRVEHGPITWSAPPQVAPIAPTAVERLVPAER